MSEKSGKNLQSSAEKNVEKCGGLYPCTKTLTVNLRACMTNKIVKENQDALEIEREKKKGNGK